MSFRTCPFSPLYSPITDYGLAVRSNIRSPLNSGTRAMPASSSLQIRSTQPELRPGLVSDISWQTCNSQSYYESHSFYPPMSIRVFLSSRKRYSRRLLFFHRNKTRCFIQSERFLFFWVRFFLRDGVGGWGL